MGVVLAVVGGFILLDRRDREGAAPAPVASSQSPGPPAVGGASPRETAELLFNRTMAASEQGDTAEAQRFAPMALEAYRRLGVLDDDGRYHVGLIHLTLGDVESARAEREAIRRSAPDHLLGIMLEHAVAEAEGDVDGVRRTYSRFLEAYDAEMTINRPEYRDHERGIEGFRVRAAAAAAR